jgi:hypothetical protein
MTMLNMKKNAGQKLSALVRHTALEIDRKDCGYFHRLMQNTYS